MNYKTDFIDAYMESVIQKHSRNVKSSIENVTTITLDVEDLFEFFDEVKKERNKNKLDS